MSTENNSELLFKNSIKILTDLISFKTISGENNNSLIAKVIEEGNLESNKGVHIDYKINLNKDITLNGIIKLVRLLN